MTVLTDVVTPAVVQTLGWTLLHFLWQGAAGALVLAVLLWLTRRSSPSMRYSVSCAELALMMVLPFLTYAMLWPQVITATELSYDLVVPSAQPSQVETATTDPMPGESARSTATQPNWLRSYLPYMVAVWFLGVVVLSVRLIGGLWLLRKLKTCFNQPLNP